MRIWLFESKDRPHCVKYGTRLSADTDLSNNNNNENEEMIVAVNAIYAYTDVGSRSIVGSYVPVKEMSVNYI